MQPGASFLVSVFGRREREREEAKRTERKRGGGGGGGVGRWKKGEMRDRRILKMDTE